MPARQTLLRRHCLRLTVCSLTQKFLSLWLEVWIIACYGLSLLALSLSSKLPQTLWFKLTDIYPVTVPEAIMVLVNAWKFLEALKESLCHSLLLVAQDSPWLVEVSTRHGLRASPLYTSVSTGPSCKDNSHWKRLALILVCSSNRYSCKYLTSK